MQIDFDDFGGQAFILALGCGVVTSIMKWFDHLDNPTYGMIISVSVGSYIAKSTFDEHNKIRASVQTSIASKQAEASPPNIVEQVSM